MSMRAVTARRPLRVIPAGRAEPAEQPAHPATEVRTK